MARLRGAFCGACLGLLTAAAAAAVQEPLFQLPMDFPDGTKAVLEVYRDSEPHALVTRFCARYGCVGDDLYLLVTAVHAQYLQRAGACPLGLRAPLQAEIAAAAAAGAPLRPSSHCVCSEERSLRRDGLGCDAPDAPVIPPAPMVCVGPVCSEDWTWMHEGAAEVRAAAHASRNGSAAVPDDPWALLEGEEAPLSWREAAGGSLRAGLAQPADWERRAIILTVLLVVGGMLGLLGRVVAREVRRLQALPPPPTLRARRRAQVREFFRAVIRGRRSNSGRGGRPGAGKGGPIGSGSNRNPRRPALKNMHGKRRHKSA